MRRRMTHGARGAVGLLMLSAALAACSSRSETTPDARPSARSGTVSSGTVTTSTSTAATLGIPPGHLPAPGECRIWMPGTPPGHQRQAGPCSALERQVPPGGWLVYRPSEDKKTVRVWVYSSDGPRPTLTRLFDAVSGTLLSEEIL